eukprot:m51a1_g3923 putative 40S ribosomal protein S24e (140) ;mRNA; r:183542-184242
MSEKGSAITIRTRKFMINRLLQRKQFVIIADHPGAANVSKKTLREMIAKVYKVSDPATILVYGMRTAFGGGRSTGFGIIYDNITALKKFAAKYLQVREGFLKKKEGGRKQRKERRNKAKKQWGTRQKVKASSEEGSKKK